MKDSKTSVWVDDTATPSYSPLQGERVVDVAIIGAGITGVTAATLLKRAGLKVAVLEAMRVGEGVTGHTTAHVTEVLDTRYHQLIKNFGLDGATLAARSQREAIELIASLAAGSECDFERVPGYLYAEGDQDPSEIEREAEAAAKLGLPVSLVSDVPLPFEVILGARFDDQAQFHPRRYLAALLSRIPGDGSQVFEETRVLDVDDGEPCVVRTEHGTVRATYVIVAANVPVTNKFFLHTKIAAYRSYVVAARLGAPAPKGLFWDVADPYHYTRSHVIRGEELLIVGGEDHKVGQDDDTRDDYTRLSEYVRAHYPVVSFEHRWSAQVIEPVDGLPYIGRNALQSRVFVATGYAGNGITGGTLAARIVSDLCLGITNPYADLYAATRIKPLASLKEYVAENVDFPKHLALDRLRPPRAVGLGEVPLGEGRITSVDGHRLAVYRHEDGRIDAVSPVCTHLGCEVQFNTAEKTWDCPCHGSRFDTAGRVVDGPAVKPLAAHAVAVEKKAVGY